jgi:hypothetical protein
VGTPTFTENLSGNELSFENGGMDRRLSDTGNTVRCGVAALEARSVDAASPGATWSTHRTVGVKPRRVVWDVQLKCPSHDDMNAVEAVLDGILQRGEYGVLTDGKGRAGPGAVLSSVTKVGPRVPAGSVVVEGEAQCEVLQRYQLVFLVEWPSCVFDGL